MAAFEKAFFALFSFFIWEEYIVRKTKKKKPTSFSVFEIIFLKSVE